MGFMSTFTEVAYEFTKLYGMLQGILWDVHFKQQKQKLSSTS